MGRLKPGFGRLASLQEALGILDDHPLELSGERVPLDQCPGRVLASAVTSGVDVPHFAKAAMDGYAVIASDTFPIAGQGPLSLKIRGALSPGQIASSPVGAGTCIEIGTGAPMPEGADSVVMVENTEPDGETAVWIRKPVAPGDNVIRRASDIRAGSVVLEKGAVVGPSQLGVLAAVGATGAEVCRRPRVAHFSTGAELLAPGEELAPGRIYDINGHTLAAALAADGCEVVNLGVVHDNLEALLEAVRRGVEEADLLLLSGGSSLGGGDLVVEAFEKLGKLLLHGVAVKPGKPLVLATASDSRGRTKMMVGLPGYPMSALSDYLIFVRPYLRKASGAAALSRWTEASLARKHFSVVGRYEFLPVRLDEQTAHPLTGGSSSISALARADGFVEVDENTEVLEEGSRVRVQLL